MFLNVTTRLSQRQPADDCDTTLVDVRRFCSETDRHFRKFESFFDMQMFVLRGDTETAREFKYHRANPRKSSQVIPSAAFRPVDACSSSENSLSAGW